MLAAKSQEDVQKCLPQNRKSLVVRIAGDLSGYSDTNSVAVYTPGFNASIVSPTAGMELRRQLPPRRGQRGSPDIVSTASPPFEEYPLRRRPHGRVQARSLRRTGVGQHLVVTDYDTGGLRLTGDFNDKLITPTLHVQLRSHRPRPTNQNSFNDLKGKLDTHEFEGGVTFVLSPTAIAVGGTAQFERGDQSQPYRYIAMFDPDTVAPFVPNGATVDLVNRTRLPVRPLEQLPTSRDRIASACASRSASRRSTGALQAQSRLYYDS